MITNNIQTLNKEVINVSENPIELYDWCVENKCLNDDENDYDSWFQNNGDLRFFEGDPDMVKIGKEIGYFFDTGDKVFLWMFDEDCYDAAEKLVSAYCNAFESKVTRGGESYRIGSMPNGMQSTTENNWHTWEKLNFGIAWRGGAGYVYDIIDCSRFAESINN